MPLDLSLVRHLVRRRFAVALGIGAACAVLCVTPAARAGDRGAPGPAGPPGAPSPLWAPDMGMRVDGRVTSDPAADRRVVGPVAGNGWRAPSVEIPYRVEPRDANGQLVTPWDVPPEKPDPRDFEEVRTFDELANPHYEIREEIWSTPEDFITRDGVGRVNGLAYVPYWARNTIRWGRFQFFPFAEVQGSWTSNVRETSHAEDAFEVLVSAGVLAEYLFPGGKTKFKAAARGDYHWYSDVLDDTGTYIGGLGLEHRISPRLTVDGGVEFERSQVLVSRDVDPTLGQEVDIVERISLYANGRWDRFLSNDLRLEGGVAWAQNRGDGAQNDRLDYDEQSAYARLGWAIMRHESFAYGEYRVYQRDATGLGTDLDLGQEIRLGVDDILPHARTRRLSGNAWVGWAMEEYQGGNDDSRWTAGLDLTYRPSPYTSAYLSFVHQNTFSAIEDFNREDEVTIGITQNLSNRLIGRVAASWSQIEPDGRSSSDRLALGTGLRWVVSDNVDLTVDYELVHRFAGAGLDEATGHRIAIGSTVYLR